MLETNKIYNQDCLEGLKLIEDNSIDCIIIDPPYGINYFSGYYKNGNPHKPIANDNILFIPIELIASINFSLLSTETKFYRRRVVMCA